MNTMKGWFDKGVTLAALALATTIGLTAQAANVAKVTIGETATEYADLATAIAAATGNANATVELLCDVDLGGAAWTAATFNHATFDGKGYKVSNFTASSANGKMVGFFGNAGQSTIKNLTVEKATINGINHVGAIAGYGICIKIENCKAINCTVTTSVANNDDGDKAGGIIGYMPGEPNAWVKNCTVSGCTIRGYRDIGGVIGYAESYASGTALVKDTVVKDTLIINERANNYKGYATDAAFDVKAVVGDVGSVHTSEGIDYIPATIENTTTQNVKFLVLTAGFTVDSDGVYHIIDLAGLKAFRDQVNVARDDANYTTVKDGKTIVVGYNPFKGKTIQLDADIDMLNEDWNPIRVAQDGGLTFDGNGKTISNLKVTEAQLDASKSHIHAGLFGEAPICTFNDLTIDGANVVGYNHVAAIAGYGICAHFVNCAVSNATITAKQNLVDGKLDNGDKAGAICGYLSGENTAEVTNCTIENCTVTGYRDIGGAVGIANNKATVQGTTVKNTTVTCDLANNENYKDYTTDAAFDVNKVVGETASAATVSGNTAGDDVKVAFKRNVAQIGSVQYASLADAIAAVPAGAAEATTITMIADVEYSATGYKAGSAILMIPNGKEIVLELNGKKITCVDTFNAALDFLRVNGDLTIQDSSEGKTGEIVLNSSNGWNANYAVNLIWVGSNGKLTIEGGKYGISTPTSAYAAYVVCASNNSGSSDVIINGGTFIGTKVDGVVRLHDQDDRTGTHLNVTINGGDFTLNGGTDSVVWLDVQCTGDDNSSDADLVITGGTFTSVDSNPVLDIGSWGESKTLNVEISGGAFKSAGAVIKTRNLSDAAIANIRLSGGIYSGNEYYNAKTETSVSLNAICAEGYALADNSEAGYPYAVTKAPDQVYVIPETIKTVETDTKKIEDVKPTEEKIAEKGIDQATAKVVVEKINHLEETAEEIAPATGVAVLTDDINAEVQKEIQSGAIAVAEGETNVNTLVVAVQLTEIKVANVTVSQESTLTNATKATFEVKPVVSVQVTKINPQAGDAVKTNNYEVAIPAGTLITFRLPVDASTTAVKAEAFHEKTSIGYYDVKSEGEGANVKKFVEITSSDFSPYSYALCTSVTADSVAMVNGTGYETLQAAIDAAEAGQTVTVLKDTAVSAGVTVDKKITLDLNGKVVSADSSFVESEQALFIVKRGGDLTVEDTSTDKTGELKAFTADGSSVTKLYTAVKMISSSDTGDAVAKLTVNGGKLSALYYAIVGNGSRNGTVITVNGGEVVATQGLAIYHPQNGTLTINGGSLTGVESAVEIRAGSLTVTGGSLTATATEFSCNPNGSGNTTVGAALAIAQHTTKVDISVSISGGTFTGVKALHESNPQANDPTPQVTMSVSDGTFNGEVTLTDVSKCISGGTYSTALDSAYVADGYEATQVGEKWIVGTAYVAQIGTTKYATLAEAVTNATANCTIKMIGNATLTEELAIGSGKNFVLDLNGKTIENAATGFQFTTTASKSGAIPARFMIIVEGALTITDTSAGKNGKISAKSYDYGSTKAILVKGNGAVTLTEGEVYGQYAGIYVIGYTGDDPESTQIIPSLTLNGGVVSGEYGISLKGKTATVTVNDGAEITASGEFALGTNGTTDWYDGGNCKIIVNGGAITAANGHAIYNPAEAVVVIRGGVLTGATGVAIKGGDVTIEQGATIVATGAKTAAAANGNGATNTGDALYIEDTYANHAPTVTVTGGEFTSANGFAVQYYTNKTTGKGSVSLTGGTYSSDVSDYVASGYEAVKSATLPATWTVDVKKVAQIGDVKYTTLAAALSAAKSGDTITLLADVADAGTISLPANVTLDGNGKTISGNSAVYINVAGGTVKNTVFEDIHNSGNKLSAVYATGAFSGTATITGCTFDNCDWDAIQVTPVAGAVVTITGNTFDTDNTDGVTQQRYVHIQSAANVDFSATVTNNIMKGNVVQGSLEVYYFTDSAKVDLTKNYIEDMADVCILEKSGANVCEKIYPVYTNLTAEGAIDTTSLASPVAMIKSTYNATAYMTLAAAADAAKSGETVTLLANVDLGTTGLVISEEKNFTLDIGAFNITGAVNGKLITNNGTLVINGTTGCVYNTDVTAQGHDAVYNVGTLTINGGWFGDSDNDKTNANAYNRGGGLRNCGAATINGGHFTACDNFTGAGNGYAYAIINDSTQLLTINDADVYGANNGNIGNGSGTVVVNGGTYSITGSLSHYNLYSCGTLEVYGGDFYKNDTGSSLKTICEDENGKVYVAGGSFNKEEVKNYLVSGYEVVKSGDRWVVQKAPVAQIGETKYDTLEAAAEAATEGQTIKLIADVDLSSYARSAGHAITFADNVTVDMNGKKISSNNYGVIYAGNGLTFFGGTFESVGTDPNYALFFGDRANKTAITDVVLSNVVCRGGINVYKTELLITDTKVFDSTSPNAFYAVWGQESSAITIEGTEFTSTATYGSVISGDATSSFDLKGGTYYSGKSCFGGGTFVITGGKFTSDPTKARLGPGCVAVQAEVLGTNWWTVTQHLARVVETDEIFDTLAAAVEAAEAGQTVELFMDTTETVNITKNLTIKGNGHTLTGTTAGNPKGLVFNNGTAEVVVTLDNLKINATSAGYPIYVSSPVDLTVVGGQMDGYCSVYFKPTSTGSSLAATNVVFNAPRDKSGSSDHFGLFVIRADGVSLDLVDCQMDASGSGTANHAIIAPSTSEGATVSEGYFVRISGENTVVKGTLLYNNGGFGWGWNYENKIVLEGGTYTLDAWEIYNQDVSDIISVKGGTYNLNPQAVPYYSYSTYNVVHPDFAATALGTNPETWGIVQRPVVAQVIVGTVTNDICSVASLNEFLDGLTESATVRLVADMDVPSSTYICVGEDAKVLFDLNGHTIAGNRNGTVLTANEGELTIVDSVGTGVITNANTSGSAVNASWGKLTISNGTFVASTAITSGSSGQISIAGGIFSGNLSSYGTWGITGGTFTVDVSEKAADGYACEKKGDVYIVRTAVEADYVAQIGETKYLTMNKAIKAAANDATIVLLKDAEYANYLSSSAAYTFDGPERTLTLSQNISSPITFNCYVVACDTISAGFYRYAPDSTKLASGRGVATKENGYYYVTYAKYIDNGKLYRGEHAFNPEGYVADGYTAVVSGSKYYIAPTANVADGKIVKGIYEDSCGKYVADGLMAVSAKDANNAYRYIVGANIKTNNGKIIGGTFADDITDYVDTENFNVTQSGDKWSVSMKEGHGVARIGETEYTLLVDAIAAAQTGDVIVMKRDTVESVTVDKDLTLDLNGCIVSNSSYVVGVKANVTFTLKDSSEDADGALVCTSGYNYGGIVSCGNNATVNVLSGRVIGNNCALGYNGTWTGVTYNILGGIVTAKYGLYDGSGTTVLNITGGTFIGTTKSVYDYYWNGMVTANVTGGRVMGLPQLLNNSTFTVSGGEFSFDPSTATKVTVAEGKTVCPNPDDDYPYAVGIPTAQVVSADGLTTNTYVSIDAAAAAAQAVGVELVTLVADVDYTCYAAKTFHTVDLNGLTLNLNGHTITSNNGGVAYDGSNVTISNGTFVAANGGSYALFYGNGSYDEVVTGVVIADVTCQGGINVFAADVTIRDTSATGGAGTDYYAVWADKYANVVIEGGSFTSQSTLGGNVLDASQSGTSSITVKGGKFLVPESVGLIASGASVTIYGGIFSKEPDAANVAEGCKLVANPDAGTSGTYPYAVSVESVAKIVTGTTTNYYATLAAAIAAVSESATKATTITMIADTSIDVATAPLTVSATRNIVLDLNGHLVQGNCSSGTSSALITNMGTLTIADSSDTDKNGSGNGRLIAGADPTWKWGGDTSSYAGSYASNLIRNEGALTIESGYLKNVSNGSAAYVVDNYNSGTIVITGGKLETAFASTVRMFYSNDGSSVSISGTTELVSGERYALQVMGGSPAVIITGGKLTSHGSTLTDDYYSITEFSRDNATFDISGGEFSGDLYFVKNGSVKGGIYSVAPDAGYLATDCSVLANTDADTSETYPYAVGVAVASITSGEPAATVKYGTYAESILVAGDDNLASIAVIKPEAQTPYGYVVKVADPAAEAKAYSVVLCTNLTTGAYCVSDPGSALTNGLHAVHQDNGFYLVQEERTIEVKVEIKTEVAAEDSKIKIADTNEVVTANREYAVQKLPTGTEVKKTQLSVSTGKLDLNIPLQETATYQVEQRDTVTEGGVTTTNVSEILEVGVVKVESDVKNQILAVPFKEIGTKEEVKIANLIQCEGFTENDKVYHYNTLSGKYEMWQYSSSNTWDAVTTAGSDVTIPDPATLKALETGETIFLSRQNVTKPVFLVGSTTSKPENPDIAKGNVKKGAATAITNPTMEPIALNTAVSEATNSDYIYIPSAGGLTLATFDGVSWATTTVTTNTIKVAGQNVEVIKRTRNTNVTIPAGTGFWYLNRGSGSKFSY